MYIANFRLTFPTHARKNLQQDSPEWLTYLRQSTAYLVQSQIPFCERNTSREVKEVPAKRGERNTSKERSVDISAIPFSKCTH